MRRGDTWAAGDSKFNLKYVCLLDNTFLTCCAYEQLNTDHFLITHKNVPRIQSSSGQQPTQNIFSI